jgi:hypothetical protein
MASASSHSTSKTAKPRWLSSQRESTAQRNLRGHGTDALPHSPGGKSVEAASLRCALKSAIRARNVAHLLSSA